MSYGSQLIVTCLGIAPCYAISELLFSIPEWFTMSGYCTMLCNSDIFSARGPPDLKIPFNIDFCKLLFLSC